MQSEDPPAADESASTIKARLATASPFQSMRLRSRAKQQAAGGVLAATLLAGQHYFDVKQSHILQLGVPRKVLLTVTSQAITLIQSAKTMKPLESYPLQQAKLSFRHGEGSFTIQLQDGRELVFTSEETVEIEAEIGRKTDEQIAAANEQVAAWLQAHGVSDPQMVRGAVRALKKRDGLPGAWAGLLQQMSQPEREAFLAEAAARKGEEQSSEEEAPLEESGSDDGADTQTTQQRIFGFRDKLPQNLGQAKNLAQKATGTLLANLAGPPDSDDSDDGSAAPGDTLANDARALSEDEEMDYVDSASDVESASADSFDEDEEDAEDDFVSDAESGDRTASGDLDFESASD